MCFRRQKATSIPVRMEQSRTGHAGDEWHNRAVRRQRRRLWPWLLALAAIAACAALPPGLAEDRARCARYEIQSCGDPADPAMFSCRVTARRLCLRSLGWDHERGQWVRRQTDADRAREIEEAGR